MGSFCNQTVTDVRSTLPAGDADLLAAGSIDPFCRRVQRDNGEHPRGGPALKHLIHALLAALAPAFWVLLVARGVQAGLITAVGRGSVEPVVACDGEVEDDDDDIDGFIPFDAVARFLWRCRLRQWRAEHDTGRQTFSEEVAAFIRTDPGLVLVSHDLPFQSSHPEH